MEKRRGKPAAYVVAGACLLVVAWFYWPGRWQYFSDGHLRIHRLTGRAEMLTQNGWLSMEPREQEEASTPVTRPPLTQAAPAPESESPPTIYRGRDHFLDAATRLKNPKDDPLLDALSSPPDPKHDPLLDALSRPLNPGDPLAAVERGAGPEAR